MEEKIEEIEGVAATDGVAPDLAGQKVELARKRVVVVLLVLVVVLTGLGLLVGLPLFAAYREGKEAYRLVTEVKEAVKSQDISRTRRAIAATREQWEKVKNDLAIIGWTRVVPFFGAYSADLFHLVAAGESGLVMADTVAEALEPYADLLGFKGQGSFAGGTAEDRLVKFVETLDKLTPKIDVVSEQIKAMRNSIDRIDGRRYPQTLGGRVVRQRITDVKTVVDLTDELLSEARPMVKKLPELLGAFGEAKYLILFQNDKELRPTGGFITAYAVFRVEKGKIHLETADDIYKLDDTVTKNVTPPEEIIKYLNVYGWRLRDANFSPDFFESMRTFEDIYASSTQKKKINGIIAVDTHFLTRMMDVLGPLEIYGLSFTTKEVPECNCPMVVYELLKAAGLPRGYWVDNRKDMIGVLLSGIMKKAMVSPKQVYGKLWQTVWDAASEKHVLVYLKDADAQKGVEALGFAGRIKTYDGDYLHVNDGNLAGAKSNLFIVATVRRDVAVTSEGANVTLTLEYKYPRVADNCSLERKEGLCLAGIYRDYLRVYLPRGSEVEEVRGFESKSRTFASLDHTVVDGYFTVVPQGLAKIEIKYRVPGDFKKRKEYRLLIQKQPGTLGNRYRLTVNGKVSEFDLVRDKEIVVKL